MTWEQLTAQREEHTCNLIKGETKILVAGGWGNGRPHRYTETTVIIDVASKTVESGPSMNVARAWHASFYLDGKVYVMGGYVYTKWQIRDTIEYFDEGTQTWTIQTEKLSNGIRYMGYASVPTEILGCLKSGRSVNTGTKLFGNSSEKNGHEFIPGKKEQMKEQMKEEKLDHVFDDPNDNQLDEKMTADKQASMLEEPNKDMDQGKGDVSERKMANNRKE